MSSKSPCAACKGLRRKCTQECVLAPYFPPDNPEKFANVHKVFGASNVTKLLIELDPSQREDAVNSLEYEAKARLHDPVYGCVGVISVLHQRLHHMKTDLENARKELADYLGPQAMVPILHPAALMPQGHHAGNPSLIQQQVMAPKIRIPPPHQHQFFETQAQFAAAMARDDQYEVFRAYEQQHHSNLHQQKQQDIASFDAGFDGPGAASDVVFHQITSAEEMSPSLALGTYDDPYQIQQQKQEHGGHGHPLQAQLLLQPQQQLQQTRQTS